MAMGNGFHPVRRVATWFQQTHARAWSLTSVGDALWAAGRSVPGQIQPDSFVAVTVPKGPWEEFEGIANPSPAVQELQTLGSSCTVVGDNRNFVRFSLRFGEVSSLAKALRREGNRAMALDMAAGIAFSMTAVAIFTGLLLGANALLGLSLDGAGLDVAGNDYATMP